MFVNRLILQVYFLEKKPWPDRVLRIDKLLQASRFYEFWEPGQKRTQLLICDRFDEQFPGDHRPVCDQLRTQPFVKSIIRLLCSYDATNPTVRAGQRGQLGKSFAMQRVFVALEIAKWDIVFCYMKDPLQIMRCHLFSVHCLLAK
ncbi:hypothetical protein T11_10732 [Trichinella zimbabwensis]|uniref:Uncharacterized protein n=1 Tax=Trichinella zimbabwensis TaxID=268475 RepID=A0A0V1I714_9BILA|nr:hypothetical protein T11_10732 [Trichinella zimbabwensis]